MCNNSVTAEEVLHLGWPLFVPKIISDAYVSLSCEKWDLVNCAKSLNSMQYDVMQYHKLAILIWIIYSTFVKLFH